MSQSIQILHLSDFHYRANWHEEVGKVQSALFDDLATECASHANLYAVFSGDFVQSGSDQCLFENVTSSFDTVFNDLGLPRERRIIVPGNHDIDRNYISENFQDIQDVIDRCEDEKSFNDYLETDKNRILLGSIQNYSNFERAFGAMGSGSDHNGVRCYAGLWDQPQERA